MPEGLRERVDDDTTQCRGSQRGAARTPADGGVTATDGVPFQGRAEHDTSAVTCAASLDFAAAWAALAIESCGGASHANSCRCSHRPDRSAAPAVRRSVALDTHRGSPCKPDHHFPGSGRFRGVRRRAWADHCGVAGVSHPVQWQGMLRLPFEWSLRMPTRVERVGGRAAMASWCVVRGGTRQALRCRR
jgi:hypothetical protein